MFVASDLSLAAGNAAPRVQCTRDSRDRGVDGCTRWRHRLGEAVRRVGGGCTRVSVVTLV